MRVPNKGKCRRAVGGVIILNEFLQPYKEQIVKETVEVMEMFKQQLAPDIFANLNQSLDDVSSIPELTKHPPNVQSSGGTNDREHNQACGVADVGLSCCRLM